MLTFLPHPANINISQQHLSRGNMSFKSIHGGLSHWVKAKSCSPALVSQLAPGESEEWNQVQMLHVPFILLSCVSHGHKLSICRQRSSTNSETKKYWAHMSAQALICSPTYMKHLYVVSLLIFTPAPQERQFLCLLLHKRELRELSVS